AYWIKIEAVDKAKNAALTQNDQERARTIADVVERQQNAESAAALYSVAVWQRAYAQIEVDAENRLRQVDQQERELKDKFKGSGDDIQKIEDSAQMQRVAIVDEA